MYDTGHIGSEIGNCLFMRKHAQTLPARNRSICNAFTTTGNAGAGGLRVFGSFGSGMPRLQRQTTPFIIGFIRKEQRRTIFHLRRQRATVMSLSTRRRMRRTHCLVMWFWSEQMPKFPKGFEPLIVDSKSTVLTSYTIGTCSPGQDRTGVDEVKARYPNH